MTKDLLELETRSKIFDFIVQYPGIHLRELERALGMSAPLLDYHLRVLLRGGLVSVLEEEAYKRYYPEPSSVKDVRVLSPGEKRMLALLRQEIPLSIVLYLLRMGNTRHGEIAAELGLRASTLSYHLGKLVTGEIVEKTSVGKKRGYRLKDRDGTFKLLIACRPLSKDMFDRFVEIWRELY
ncbi:MAG: winged helix-turn-helix transcriptional regulator [Thermoplasmata archaeon]